MLENLSGETKLYPIFGDPIAFVKSPNTFTAGLEGRGQNAVCVPMQVGKDDLAPVMEALTKIPNVAGLLVTMPHKSAAYAYCTSGDKTAETLKAVSVMRRNDDGSWYGGMLDGEAFVKAQIDAGAKPGGAKVLLVGAGSAGGAIAVALLEAGVKELLIHDANDTSADELVTILRRSGKGLVRRGSSDPTGCDMVCNATPMGLGDDDPIPVDADKLTSSMFVGDVIAGHGTTPLIAAAQKAGCNTANGVQMVEAVQEMMLDFMLPR